MTTPATSPFSDRWRALRATLLSPRVDERALETALAAAKGRAPVPVVWLIGKTQSGKTSIIRALTGSEHAEIGNGFRPCTRTARLYDYPSEAPVVRFLDTRGLGEVAYDPEEDIRFGESQAHLLLAVMKAGDQDQEAVLEVLREARGRHPEWPLIIAQTGLHELYPDGAEHPSPYPFSTEPWPAGLPHELARSLRFQRERAGDLPGKVPAHWVPIDLTLPEDGLEPEDYGLDALWEAIESVSAFRLRWLLAGDKDVEDLYASAAHPHIIGYTLAAAGLGALPVVDLAGVPAIQAKLLQSLAALYERPWDRKGALELLTLLGAGIGVAYAARAAGRALIKLIPYFGQTLGAVWGATASGAATYALGKAAAYYFHQRSLGLEPEAEVLRGLYTEGLDRGSDLLRDRFRSGGT